MHLLLAFRSCGCTPVTPTMMEVTAHEPFA